MPMLHSGLLGRKATYQITNSVRLRASASAYFSRTFGAGGDRDKWWILIPEKRSTLGATQYLFGADTASADAVYFNSSDKLCIDIAGTNRLISTRVFRDPSAWGAFLVVYDASNGTNALKLRVYYIDNGFAELTAWDTDTRSGITAGTAKTTLNTAAAVIGKNPTAANSYFDGYLAHFHIGSWSGSQPTPASFGGTDSNGVWVFSGASSAYGTQGSWLDFKDAALTAGSNVGLGKDVSGNANYWNTNNISVTAGATYDSMVDTPTNNYCTGNAVDVTGGGLNNGNINWAPSGGANYLRGTVSVSSGKWYFEGKLANVGTKTDFGLFGSQMALSSATARIQYRQDGNKVVDAAPAAYGATYTTGDTLAIAFDFTGQTVEFFKNNVSQGVISYPFSANASYAPGFYGNSNNIDLNFGQRPFTYTPPTGFKALCTANLPAVAITKPSAYFDAKTRTGTGAAFNVTGEAFAPDLVWTKGRSGATDHILSNILSGTTKYLSSNATTAETTDAQAVTAFNSDGFSGGTMAALNTNAATYIDWMWKAGGAGVTNNSGSISSQVSANAAAGFSIVTYTGTGANATVGHGLGVAPKLVIVRCRNAAQNWAVSPLPTILGSNAVMYLNSTAASSTADATIWNSTYPTSTTLSLGTNGLVNGNTYQYVAYCFAEIAGYSKFGSYAGNGSADGTFVYTGFRPRYVLVKSSTAVDDWRIYDSLRPGYNVIGGTLLADTAGAETTTAEIDFTANGFKARIATTPNAAQTYIFAAFAEFPFGGSNVSPAPAR